MYGIVLSSTKKEKQENTFIALRWLCGDDALDDKKLKGDRSKRVAELINWIEHNVITDKRISAEDVYDETINSLMRRDYDIDRAVNEESGYTKSIESFIHDTAKYTYLDIIDKGNKEHGGPIGSLDAEITDHSGSASKEGESRTLGDSIPDLKAEQDMDMMQDVSLEQAVNNMLKLDCTSCKGFIALYMCQALCNDASKVETCKKQVCDMMKIKPDITNRIRNCEEVRETVKDLSKFKCDDVVEELYRTVPSSSDIAELIEVVVEAC